MKIYTLFLSFFLNVDNILREIFFYFSLDILRFKASFKCSIQGSYLQNVIYNYLFCINKSCYFIYNFLFCINKLCFFACQLSPML